ncbi:MAG TPA: hypothetical protein VHL32_07800 [Gemmatimonadaceae bacterium]|jgi:hypothetical protein|nr:hypothetical protein [Gemmatimonadaceae bacterium]
MKRIAILLVLLIGLATTSAARSQQPDNPSKAKASAQDDSVSFKPSPELQKSLQDLALAVQSLAQRIASDPEIKAAAVRVASGLVTTTQQVVEEESGAIQQALKSAADKIAAAQSVPPEKPRKP